MPRTKRTQKGHCIGIELILDPDPQEAIDFLARRAIEVFGERWREQVERETKAMNGEVTSIDDQWAQETTERRLG